MHSHADALANAPRQMALAGADVLVEALDAALLRATGGDRRLTNLEQRAAPPRVDVSADGAEVSAGGATWSILESGTRGHVIKPRRRVLRVGDEWRSGAVRVRGVRGQHTYSDAVDRATAAVMDAQREQWERSLRGS